MNLLAMLVKDNEDLISIFQQGNPTETPARIAEYTTNAIKRFSDLCWVCLDDLNRVIGGITGSILKRKEKGYILDIAVEKKMQGQGYGRILLEKILEQFEQRDVSQISLGVHYLNAKVVPFYYHFGFRMYEVRKSEFGTGQDAIIMHYYYSH